MVRSSGMKSRLLVLALSACCSATLPGQEPRYEALPDFVVELAAEGIGSLIGCAVLPDGTLLVSVEGSGVRRLRDADGDGRFEEVMTITDELTNVQGMCWHEDHLYLVGQGPEGAGLYRLERGTPRILGRMDGWGEHGPHAVEPGPDGRLYVVIGNHTAFLGEVDPDSPYRIWHEGHLGPRLLDPRGHAVGVAAPGGVILATDAEGEHWSVIAGGFRNPYDLAFHHSGALFTFDSDMEWDIGLPWYRPTRLLHVVPGGEYGWRTGSTKWPVEYPDSMPSALDVGRGSPTGLVRYDGRQFPARFHGALLGGDWAQGRILAFFPRQRDGVGWEAGSEVLLRGRPLNVTDLVVDADGSLLFTVGGRGTRGGVHRLRYGGPDEPAPPPQRTAPWPGFDAATPARQLVAALRSDDRGLRYAAARELERRDSTPWLDEALLPGLDGAPTPALLDPRGRGELLVAMARRRLAGAEHPSRGELLSAAVILLLENPTGEARIALMRALELLFLADPSPPDGPAEVLPELLAHQFPSGERIADRQSAQLLAWLAPEETVDALLEELEASPFREEQIHFAYALFQARAAWTDSQRERLLRWYDEALRWPGGFSYRGYLEAMREQVLDGAAPELRGRFAASERLRLAVPQPSAAEPRDLERTLAFLQEGLTAAHRSRAEGLRLFDANCSACHAFGGRGRGVGPDLSTLPARFSLADQLETILEPSRQVSDQYQSLDVWTHDGDVVSGMPLRETEEEIVLLVGDGSERTVPTELIARSPVSPVSLMPAGLLDGLTLEEIADLLAFLQRPPQADELQAAASSGEPASRPGDWRRLFDGRSLAGWRGDPALWRVERGVIVGRASGLDHSSFLVSEGTYDDFLLELELRLLGGNSGVQFRSAGAGEHRLEGYQADLGESYWGSLYEEGGRGMLVNADPELWQPSLARDDWNHLLVHAEGDRLRIVLNGITTVDLRDAAARRGHLGVQLHAGGTTEIHVRNVRLRELGD